MTTLRRTAATAVAAAVCTLSVAAAAADAPRNWTGLYLGALVGYGFGKAPTHVEPYGNAANVVAVPYYISDLEPHPKGVTGGIEAGYNYQIGRAVLGIATDISLGSMSRTELGTAPPFIGGTLTTTIENKIGWYGTLRAKLGLLPTDNLLLYLTGGVAYGHTEATMTGSNAAGCPQHYYCVTASSSGISTGGVVGAGLEYAISPLWSLKAEYLAMKLGSRSFSVPEELVASPGGYTVDTDFKLQTVRAGLIYRFGD